MRKQDFSKDADLLDIEISDYGLDTGINYTRLHLPKRYDIAKYFKRSKRASAVTAYGAKRFEKGTWKRKAQEDLIEFSSDFDWQITYSFPAETRNPYTSKGVYGSKNMTYRRLYLILCERFNGGDLFIDDYFETVYPYTIKADVDRKLNEIKTDLLEVANSELEGAKATKAGHLDMRYAINRGMKTVLNKYRKFAKAWEETEGETIAQWIQQDIIACMASGQLQSFCIPHTNSRKTEMRRVKAGLPFSPVFYATGQLIEHIQLFVTIEGNKKWRTEQGILV